MSKSEEKVKYIFVNLLTRANTIYIYSPTSSQTLFQYNAPTDLAKRDPIY